MCKKKKGFTLIELLAVVVVMAVIAIIATPIVFNIIEKARKGAFQRSVEGVIKSAKLAWAEGWVTDGNFSSITYQCDSTGCYATTDELTEEAKEQGLQKLDIAGILGEGVTGKVIVSNEGVVAAAFKKDDYSAVKYDNQETIHIYEDLTQEQFQEKVEDLITVKEPPVITSIATSNRSSNYIIATVAVEKSEEIYGYQYAIRVKNSGAQFTYGNIKSSNENKFEGLTAETEYEISVVAYNKNPERDSYSDANNKTSSIVSQSTLAVDNPSISIAPANEAQVKYATVTCPVGYTTCETCTYVGEDTCTGHDENFSEYTNPLSIATNGTTVIARASDGVNTGATSTQILLIDNNAPVLTYLSTSHTTNSIRVIPNGTSDIYGYAYSFNGGEYSEIETADYHDYNNLNIANNNNSRTYTIGIKAYKKAYMNTQAYDAENGTSDANAENGVSERTVTVTLDECPTPTIAEATPSGYATSKSVTITYGANEEALNGCTAYYTLPGGTEQTLSSGASTTQTVTQNGYVVARTSDGIHENISDSREVTGIDTDNPVIGEQVTVTSTSKNITLTFTLTDASSPVSATCDYGTTTSYGSSVNAVNSAGNTYTCTFSNDLSAGTSYSYRINATDSVSHTATKLGSTSTASWTAITISASPQGVAAAKTITIESTPVPGASLQYQLGATNGTWIDYNNAFEITEDTTVYARWYDGVNESYSISPASLTVSSIVNQASQIYYNDETYTDGNDVDVQTVVQNLYDTLN